MGMQAYKQPTYTDGRTKQSFKDETDINKILQRAQKTGTISHINQFEAHYGDFADFDFFEATMQLTKGREIFDALPSEIRNEFSQSPAQFFDYVNDPANKDDLLKKLPGLAAPGRQNIDVTQRSENADLSPDVPGDPPAPPIETKGAPTNEPEKAPEPPVAAPAPLGAE